MTLLQVRTTKLWLCVVVFFVANCFASVTDIMVTNPSFEILSRAGLPEHCGHGCSFSVNEAIPGWTSSGPGNFGQFQPGSADGNTTFFNSVPDGITVAYTNSGTISQGVGTVQEGLIYTLTVDLGHRADLATFDSLADLLVGGTVIPTKGTAPGRGDWATFTATFVGTETNEDEPITIQLHSPGPQGNFDNVSLNAVPVPEPSSMLLLGSGMLGLVQVVRRKLM